MMNICDDEDENKLYSIPQTHHYKNIESSSLKKVIQGSFCYCETNFVHFKLDMRIMLTCC